MRRYLPSMLPGGYKTAQPGRSPGLLGAVSPRNQLRNGVDVSPDRSGSNMGSCAKIKGDSWYILYPRYNR